VKSICVYCGSNFGNAPIYRTVAEELGRALVARGQTLIYGGGNVGLMGVVADTVMQGGGEVIGIIPRSLLEREVGHRGVTRLEVVETMHERKTRMAELCDAFVAMPGGWGTLEELAEAATWTQLGIHRKPVGLLNVEGFYDPFLAYLDNAVAAGFIRAPHRGLVVSADTVEGVLKAVETAELPVLQKWLEKEQA
jgi:uncharacterized protein (TIGR00730 family)